MRKMLLLFLACVGITRYTAVADESPGTVDIKNMQVTAALGLYQKISGVELALDPAVKQSKAQITFRTEKPLTRAEILKVMEKVFAEQAHVVITKTDDKHASVKLKDTSPTPP